jgi:hypothetical protein
MLFPQAIECDPWIMYHGTSGQYSHSIESCGIRVSPEALTKSDIMRLTSIFEWMEWKSVAYSTLKPFSELYDLGSDGPGKLFFSECSTWALRYATREYAGGEKLRAVRNAIDELDAYLKEPKVRAEHERKLRQVPPGLPSRAVLPVNRLELGRRLSQLDDLRRRGVDVLRSHEYGVIYALSVPPSAIDRLRWNPYMGIEASVALPPEWIIAKLTVPGSHLLTVLCRTDEDYFRRSKVGLIPALKRAF